MLQKGIYLAPSAFEAGFTSLAHSEDDITSTIQAFQETFSEIAKQSTQNARKLFGLP